MAKAHYSVVLDDARSSWLPTMTTLPLFRRVSTRA